MPEPTAATPTVPESPATIATQMEQLVGGLRRVVMIPKGTPLIKKPKGLDIYSDEFGNTFYFDPSRIHSLEIARAVSEDRLPDVLGSADEGMGAPDKKDLDPNPVAVVGKDQDGTEVQASATDEQHLPETVSATKEVTPPGGDVEVVPPDVAVGERKEEKVDTPSLGAREARPKKPKPLRSMAEIKSQQLIPYTSAKHSAMAGIQQLVQRQQFDAAIKAANRALAAGKLTDDEIEHAVDRGLETPLVANSKRLGLEQLLSILPLASPAERRKLLPALGDKLDNDLPKLLPVERKGVLSSLVKLGMLLPEDM